MPARKEPVLPNDLVDQLLAGRDPSTVFDKDGLLDELKRAIAERALNAEMDLWLSRQPMVAAIAGPGFDAKIMSMYARGLTVREIRGHLDAICGVDVSPELIRAVTDDVLDEVAEWQNRSLEALYPHRSWRPDRWPKGDPGALDRAERRRRLLAAVLSGSA